MAYNFNLDLTLTTGPYRVRFWCFKFHKVVW